jgi:hypothetical protein
MPIKDLKLDGAAGADQAPRSAVSRWPVTGLDQGQEPKASSNGARDGCVRLSARIGEVAAGILCSTVPESRVVVSFVMALGAEMSLNLKSLSIANARLEMLTRTQTDLHAQFLELTELRERLREAQLSADLQKATRARKPAPVVIAAAA